jgi:integrase
MDIEEITEDDIEFISFLKQQINGIPIYTIQKLMNHKDIKMTLRYAKLSQDSGREFVNGIF